MDFQFLIRIFLTITGIFEFVMTAKIGFLPKQEVHKELSAYPESFLDPPNKYLTMIFTFYLGLLRFAWAVNAKSGGYQSTDGHGPLILWLCVVATQVSELIFFISICSMPYFNKNNDGLVTMYIKGLKGEIGDKKSKFTLTMVPLITLLVILHGP